MFSMSHMECEISLKDLQVEHGAFGSEKKYNLEFQENSVEFRESDWQKRRLLQIQR